MQARKLKQPLPVIVGFGLAGRKHLLPELICYRHGWAPSGAPRPNILMRSLAVGVWSKLLTRIAT
jgi:hypothetical protein